MRLRTRTRIYGYSKGFNEADDRDYIKDVVIE